VTNFEKLLDYFERHCQVYFPSIRNTRVNNISSFDQLAQIMLGWAENHIGKGWEKVLADGYVHFLMDVNRSQVEYERRGSYLYKKYDDVFDRVYNNPEFMNFYHWGVFVSTFAWEHHIKIYNFYKESFLTCLKPEGGHLLDLGSGSGIWSFLTTHFSPRWTSQGIDISEKSVELSTKMAANSGLANKVQFNSYDALKYAGSKKYNAAISCFLLEHLEDPKLLLQNMALNLENKGYAFITGALTASEVDHIYEFRRESEIVLMAEEAGFRVVSMYSAAPSSHPDSYRFLPRSLALILQKRKNDIW
jgi:ubiquinone/menaquinone biosynthesis C-methylase UbiE